MKDAYRVGSWRQNRSIIHDITSYYSYLPAVFIYDDLKFDFRYTLPQNEPLDHLWVNERGDTVFQKMSIGLAYFYAPSFWIADQYVKKHPEYNRNGFSMPYQMAMNINTLFFGLIVMLLMFILLRLLYSDLVAGLSLMLIYAGSNLFYYISGAPGLSHPYSLLLLTFLLLLCLLYFKKPKPIVLALIAIIFGWIVLIRPTNLLLCLIPFLLGFSKKYFPVLRTHFLTKPGNIILFIFCALIPWIPQMMYWKVAVGQFIFYSYDEEGFFFLKPHWLDGLFSYRKGWFVYSPIMFIALLGLIFKAKYKVISKTILLILLPFTYVVFSWWCWWYGGSFGSRVMIETYPFMAIGLASLIELIIRMKWFIKLPIALVFAFLVHLNQLQVKQYSWGMLHWDSMTKSAYWSIFLKDSPPSNFEELIEHPDYKRAMKEGE